MSQFLYIAGPLDEGMVARAQKVCDDLRTVTGCRPFAKAQTAEGVLFRNDASLEEGTPEGKREALHLFGECYGPEGAAWADSDILPSLRSILRERGPSKLVGLNGRYFLIVEHEGHIYTACDVGGFWPAYWGSANGRLVLASNPLLVKETLGGSELDPVGVAQTLRFGYQFDPHTVWARVRACPPGSLARWRSGSFEVQNACCLPFSQEGFGLTFQAAAEEFSHTFRTVVGERVAGRDCVVPLSGGMDSRALACVAMEHAPRVSSFTFDWKGAHDVVWGQKVAKKLRIAQRIIQVRPPQVAEAAPAAWATIGGATDLHISYYYTALGNARQYGLCCPVGFLGDSLTGEHLGRFLQSTDFNPGNGLKIWELRASASYLSSEEAGSVLRILGANHCGEALTKAFGQTTAPYPAPHEKWIAWDFLARQRRYFFFVPWLPEDSFCVVTPFLDARLLRLCLGWPVAMRWGQKAYRHFCAVHLPGLSRMPGAVDTDCGTNRRVVNSLLAQPTRIWKRLSRARRNPQWTKAGHALEGVLERCGCSSLYKECANELGARGLDSGLRRFALASVVLSAAVSLPELASRFPNNKYDCRPSALRRQ